MGGGGGGERRFPKDSACFEVNQNLKFDCHQEDKKETWRLNYFCQITRLGGNVTSWLSGLSHFIRGEGAHWHMLLLVFTQDIFSWPRKRHIYGLTLVVKCRRNALSAWLTRSSVLPAWRSYLLAFHRRPENWNQLSSITRGNKIVLGLSFLSWKSERHHKRQANKHK